MKYVSFTFDDGRRDNFTCAYPVMKKYGIPGTLFCTTGYIDGTWQKDESWHSAGEAILSRNPLVRYSFMYRSDVTVQTGTCREGFSCRGWR